MDYFNIRIEIGISKIIRYLLIFKIVFVFDHIELVTVFAFKYTLEVFKFSNTLGSTLGFNSASKTS